MPLGSSALMRATKALDPQPMKVVAVAHLGKGWVSCWMRSGRYTYRKVVVHTTNPDHLRRYTLGQAAPSGSSRLPGREVQVANGVPRGPYSG